MSSRLSHDLRSFFATLVGCALTAGSVWHIFVLEQQKTLPKATALILDSEIVNPMYDDNGPEIKLRVFCGVDGQEYTTFAYTQDFDAESDGLARRVFTDQIPARYAKGQSIDVHYDRAHADYIQLDVSVDMFSYIGHGVVALLGLGVIYETLH